MTNGVLNKKKCLSFDTCALVANTTKIRASFELASLHNLIIPTMDVKITFFNIDLNEEIYMEQIEGYVEINKRCASLTNPCMG